MSKPVDTLSVPAGFFMPDQTIFLLPAGLDQRLCLCGDAPVLDIDIPSGRVPETHVHAGQMDSEGFLVEDARF
ncbi:MAG: hypothetical protein JJ921_08060 [Pseudomonadales bacterium]|nr:hypothetical protein [Pseudomonadales bacterium]MBO6565326.1 hypothetical protein [Pseudomonadales bacterium]MBO6597898.1 hypothetical protein [Pseudomonadales bacterium]MBO6702281.1 hypothetical protein [Pseudomonadales bacterium]MBO6824305.1 hypothetical protein [Pseudomonadales bacterium]